MKRSFWIAKSPSFLICIGVITILASFLIVWGSTQMATITSDYRSNTLQVSPKNYRFQSIRFDPEWHTHFSFTVERNNIKYALVDDYSFNDWCDGRLSPKWIEASSDSRTGSGNDVEAGSLPEWYLFYNEDSYSKAVHVESFRSKAETDYLCMNSGFSLFVAGTAALMFGIQRGLPASTNRRLVFVVFCGLYLTVLVVSYSLAFSYTFLAPFGLFLLPLLANFFMGYFAGDVFTAAKIIIAGYSIHALLTLVLFHSSSVSEAFFAVMLISSYYTLQVPLGIVAALAGIIVRRDMSDIIAVCWHLVREIKQVINDLSAKFREYRKTYRIRKNHSILETK